MPDAARIAQAQALEIPVTIQGAKTVEGTEHRELFTESTKTTLTFENGAVLNLRTRVKQGQSVFLRNDQSGKEILCKVLESPAEGETGYTDLQFTETAPAFWGVPAEESEAAEEIPKAGATEPEPAAEQPEPVAAQPEAQAHQETEAAAENSPPMMSATASEKPEPAAAESESAATEPEPAAEEPEPVAAQPEAHVHQETEAAAENSLAMMSGTASEKPKAAVAEAEPAAAEPESAAQPEPAAAKPEAQAHEETENSLAMMGSTASELNVQPVRASEEKPSGPVREELVPAHEMVPEPARAPAATEPTGEQIDAALHAMASAPLHDAADPSDVKDKENMVALMQREARLAKYAALKEKAAAQIGRGPASSVASKGAELAESINEENELEAGPPKVPLMERLTTGKNALLVEIAMCVVIVVAIGFVWHAVSGLFIHPGNQAVAAAAPAAKAAPPRVPPPIVVRGPAAPVAKVSAAAPVAASSAPVAKTVARSLAPGDPAPAAKPEVVDSGPVVVEPQPVVEQPKPAEPVEPKAPEAIAAKIVAQSQPPFPPWAKNLDVAAVVKLDAVIDENGNLGMMKLVSGPRLLEHAAKDAVQLWIFEPAQTDGKPMASHMVLSVEFQR
jgi:Gram-negative bacterial TonB protein C-terminal